MQRRTLWLAATLAATAPAAHADELSALREEVAQLKKSYAERIAALEAQISRLTPAEPIPAKTGGGTPSATGFNPEISLILQGQAKRMKDVPERGITGFWAPGGHDHDGPEKRGLSLEHSELVVAANIDPNFRGHLNVALLDGQAEVEEAWFQTLGLGNGLKLKGGRFLSGIGYLNEQHAHAWDFADAPLMTKALFGEHYAQDGLQLKWVAPTDLFIELGAEAGRGAGFPGTDRNKNGSGAGSVFGHVGGDWGPSSAWRAGLSYLATRAQARSGHFEDGDPAGPNEVEGQFSGKSRTWIADFVWKWAPDGNARSSGFKFQTEYFRRTEDGTLACAADAAALPGSPCIGHPLGAYRSRQSGFYAQGIWRFAPAWRVGYRYDRLDSGRLTADLLDDGVLDGATGALAAYAPKRHSVMADWSPSEFSRLRLQFARDKSMLGVTDDQWTLQYIMSLGSHGAHSF